MSVNLGRVAFVAKGAYDAGATYEQYDYVAANNGSYVYINAVPMAGVPVEDGEYWQPLVDPEEMNGRIAELDGVKEEVLAAAATANEKAQGAAAAAADANAAAQRADEARENIRAELNGKAPVIFVDASGDIVTITDGAAMPVVSLITHIAPAADGSGDPGPDNVRPVIGWDAVSVINETSGETLSETLPETVYGGTVDWTGGQVTVTHKKEVIRSMNIRYTTVGEGFNGGAVNLTDMKENSRANGLCETLKSVSSPVGAANNCIVFGANNQTLYAVISSSLAGTTKDEFNAYLAENPLTVVYPLATPRIIHITPRQMATLKGENMIRSDAGQTEATYAADTKLYLDMRLAALASVINEPMLISMAEDETAVTEENVSQTGENNV